VGVWVAAGEGSDCVHPAISRNTARNAIKINTVGFIHMSKPHPYMAFLPGEDWNISVVNGKLRRREQEKSGLFRPLPHPPTGRRDTWDVFQLP
jgi:hypothetical protein